MRWFARRMNDNDQPSFLGFLGHWIRHLPVEDHYQWLYKENPHGEALTWLAIRAGDERIIGCTSLFPRKIFIRDHIATGVCGGDTFVAPDCRRMGIAGELHRVSNEEMIQAGVGFHFGFPNQANLSVLARLGTNIVGSFRTKALLLRVEPVVRRLRLGDVVPARMCNLANAILRSFMLHRRPVLSNDGDLFEITEFDDRYDRLIEETIPSYQICCIRDSSYLNWRYFKNPLKAHKVLEYREKGVLQGFMVVQLVDNKCILFDLFVNNKREILRNIISSFIKYAFLQSIELVTFTVNPSWSHASDLRKAGFVFGDLASRGDTLHFLPVKGYSETDYLRKLGNWYLTLGDLDSEAAV
ncbi:MAG: hypothetical protein A4E58_01686 [Syntrophorhabdus sp. PtaB.Bin006]|nr:MAG: hypothetical protein A4E58_01686 [Syntrophorhabdus sp. PtaB.Bin006]